MNCKAVYECQYCHKRYKNEKFFLKHECKTIKRLAQMQTIAGKKAFIYYETWMKLQGRHIKNVDTFINSSFFLAFIRFANFVKELKLPSVNIFIRLMVKRKFPPSMWTRNEVYVIYMEHFDHIVSPLEQAEITVDTIFSIAEDLSCDTGNIFDSINPNVIVEEIKQRKISPWIILNSKKFFEFLSKLRRININQYTIIETLVKVDHWTLRFKENKETVRVMRNIVKELNL